jgi:hypothetical protein
MTALFARVLLRRARGAFRLSGTGDRGRALAALDGFLAAPAPGSFVAAARALSDLQHQAIARRIPESGPRPAVNVGLAALRSVPGLPSVLAERLAADLPQDPGAGPRLLALAALARAYHELAGRVAADKEEMRRRWRDPPRGIKRRSSVVRVPRRGGPAS